MILEIRDGAFSYGEADIFQNIHLSLNRGDFLCLLGPNGCGKTTLLKCLGSMLQLKQGSILLNGQSLESIPPKQRAADIGYVPQEEGVAFPFSVHQMVSIGRSPYFVYFSAPTENDYEIVEASLKRVGIYHLKDKVFNKMSGGEKQLTLIARALAQQPKVMLMDEPTSHLDYGNQNRIMQLARELTKEGMAVLMSTHTPDAVFTYATKAALMYHGSLIAKGLPQDALTQDNLSLAYSMPMKIFKLTDENGNVQTFCRADNFNQGGK